MLQKRLVKVCKTIILLLLIAVVFNGCSSISKKPAADRRKTKRVAQPNSENRLTPIE